MSAGAPPRETAFAAPAAQRVPPRAPDVARRWTADDAFALALRLASLAVLAAVLLLVWQTWRGAGPALQAYGLQFLAGIEWDPVAERFGALPYVVGTLVTSAIALLLAVPFGIGAAVFLSEIAPPRPAAVISFMIELLASIPSIVYGLWGVFALAPFMRTLVEPWLIKHLGFLPLFQGFPFGLGILPAGLVLAIMVVPTVTSVSREILRALPDSLRSAAFALGATRAEAIGVTLDAARPGILGAVILALGRALGETMAVTMVIGNSHKMSWSLLAPGATMASVIANEFTEAVGKLHLAALFEVALVLFVVSLVVNAIARLIVLAATGGRRDVAGAA
jgi:phosphate transport system permease protein